MAESITAPTSQQDSSHSTKVAAQIAARIAQEVAVRAASIAEQRSRLEVASARLVARRKGTHRL